MSANPNPCASAIKQRIEAGDNADYWRNDIGGTLGAALWRNAASIDPHLADMVTMEYGTRSMLKPSQRISAP